MPFIHVELIEGRTAAQKKKLGKAITEATAEICQVPAEAVKIIFTDLKKEDLIEGGVPRSEK